MKIVTAEQMREIDRRAATDYAVPSVALMEAAGGALALVCIEELNGDTSGKSIAIFCGAGNNGGDGYVAARHLACAGAHVTVIAAGSLSSLRGDAALHSASVGKMRSIRLVELPSDGALDLNALGPFHLFVDALLGTGARFPLEGLYADVVSRLNDYGKRYNIPVIACDIPSGVDANTGGATEPVVHATRTVTFALPKPGLVVYPGSDFVGRLTLANIGLPDDVYEETGSPDYSLVTQDYVKKLLPERNETRDANKGSFGTLLVIAGSAGMAGACALTAISSLRAGVGLVMLAVPESLIDTAAALAPEAVLRGLPETSERTHGGPGALEAALALAEKADAVAIGPGMSGNKDTVSFVQQLVQSVQKPLIIDADGLNAIAGVSQAISTRGATLPTVLTPHPGEMGRLLDSKTAEIQADRFAAAFQGAERYNAVVLLKGSRTLIGAPDRRMAINRRGTAALATAGSGDVLTGVIGALLAQKLSAFDAACCGAYLHALAGENAADSLGSTGVIAGDVKDHLPLARRRLYEAGSLDEL